MPKDVEKYFLKPKALLPPRHNIHPSVNYENIWNRFEEDWKPSMGSDRPEDNPFRYFNPKPNQEHVIPDKYTSFLNSVQKKLHTVYAEVVNILPDIWLYLGKEAVSKIVGELQAKDRKLVQDRLIDFANILVSERENTQRKEADNLLKSLIHKEEIQIVKVSGAEFNPMYRGQLILNSDIASKLIIHCALSLCYSSIEAGPTKVL